MEFRPHIMKWTPMSPSSKEPGTGYEIPGVPGEPIEVPCGYHDGGIKEFKNEDNKVIIQKGIIRLDVGSAMPDLYHPVKVFGNTGLVFDGKVMNIFRGQLTWRIDV